MLCLEGWMCTTWMLGVYVRAHYTPWSYSYERLWVAPECRELNPAPLQQEQVPTAKPPHSWVNWASWVANPHHPHNPSSSRQRVLSTDIFKVFIYLLYVYECSTCMYAFVLERCIRSHYRCFSATCGCWELNSRPLQEQSMFLTTELSLQLLTCIKSTKAVEMEI